jgi:MFS family permease
MNKPILWPLHLAALLSTFVFSLGSMTAPQMKESLGADDGQSALMVGIFAAAFASGIIFCGRLGDKFGRRRLFIIGMMGLAVCSVGVACAWSPGAAIAARVAQGFAAAAMMPQILSIIQSAVSGTDRIRAVGVYTAAAGVGTVAGQVIGGFLVSAGGPDLGWRLAFAVFAVLCVLAGLNAFRLPADGGKTATADRPGRGLAAADRARQPDHRALAGTQGGVADLVRGPVGRSRWRPSPGWSFNRGATARRGGQPLLPPDVLRARPLATGGVMAMVFFGGYGAWTFNYAVLTQSGRGEPAWLSGTVLVPFCVAFLLASLQYHRITARLGGPGTMLVGALLQGIGLVGVGLVSVVSDAGWEWWFQVPAVVLGVGQALQFGPLVSTVMAEVPERVGGLTGGLISTMQQTGIAAGVATIGAAYTWFQSLVTPTQAFGIVSVGQVALVAAFAVGAVVLRRAAKSAASAAPVPAAPEYPDRGESLPGADQPAAAQQGVRCS